MDLEESTQQSDLATVTQGEKKNLHWWKRRNNFNSESWDHVIYYFLWKCKLSLNNLSLSGLNFLFSSDSSPGAKINLPSTQGAYRVVAEK